jgi:hypothetical protein
MYKINISFIGHMRSFVCIFYTVLSFSVACIADTGLAQETDDIESPAGQASDETISPRKVKPEWKMPDFYPADGFDGMGLINDIAVNDGTAVINDLEFNLSPYAEYHTPTYKYAPGALFKKGDKVGYILDSERNITSMWLIVIQR